MGRVRDLSGKCFNKLTVVNGSYSRVNGKTYWDCICECGETVSVRSDKLTSGHTKSCGCLQIESATTHGMWMSSEFRSWRGMKTRCYNGGSTHYHNYGSRGIKVCDRWLESFENFYEDMGDKPSKDHSLDRIDNDGDYCPENCRWATRKEQQRNRRVNRMFTHKGETRCLSEWIEILGLSTATVNGRLYTQGKSLVEALGLQEEE